jgi:hypothetical protein
MNETGQKRVGKTYSTCHPALPGPESFTLVHPVNIATENVRLMNASRAILRDQAAGGSGAMPPARSAVSCSGGCGRA